MQFTTLLVVIAAATTALATPISLAPQTCGNLTLTAHTSSGVSYKVYKSATHLTLLAPSSHFANDTVFTGLIPSNSTSTLLSGGPTGELVSASIPFKYYMYYSVGFGEPQISPYGNTKEWSVKTEGGVQILQPIVTTTTQEGSWWRCIREGEGGVGAVGQLWWGKDVTQPCPGEEVTVVVRWE
ncbi:hypothetical protein EDC01DRAFT_629382 [Geopyxis carbonaria]|nr:hypothetical protein EDC01DRAFT_629382 [Geopyxis carbonaria]